MHWVIENQVFSNQAAGLIQALKAAGHGLTLWSDALLERSRAPWSAETVVFHGALGTVLDLVHTAQGYRLLELNSFSCSDLYACDPTAVVRSVAETLL
jgi:hypothetical protein